MNAYTELLESNVRESTPSIDNDLIEQVTTEAPTGSGKSAFPAILSRYSVNMNQVADRLLITPQMHGLDFVAWRENQLETAFEIRDSFGVSANRGDRTVVLTRTKSLQTAYADFGAAVLYGRANYRCIHPGADPETFCNECLFAERGMHKCPYSQDCEYLLAKDHAMNSPFACVNYAYWLVARRFKDSAIANLVLDECQLLDDITLKASGVVINDRTRKDYDLPYFPIINGEDDFEDQDLARDWLELAKENLGVIWKMYSNRAKTGDKTAAKEAQKVERIGTRIANALSALDSSQMAWYIRSGPNRVFFRGRQMPGIKVQPLKAGYHYKRLFFGDWNPVAMSATVGNFDTFNKNLGLTRVVNIRVPNVWGTDTRPIHILDCPAMSFKTQESGKRKQAAVIAAAIQSCPHEWSGLVHVTKKTAAIELARKLSLMGLEDRVWVTPQKDLFGRFYGTQEQVALWHERRSQVPNSILIAWQLWEGYDGLEEQICIVGKVPFPYLGDEYEQERMKHDRKQYTQRTASQIVQAWGRIRRGRPCDYDDPQKGIVRTYVAVADMNITRVLSYMPLDILEALRCDDKKVMAKVRKAIKKVR